MLNFKKNLSLLCLIMAGISLQGCGTFSENKFAISNGSELNAEELSKEADFNKDPGLFIIQVGSKMEASIDTCKNLSAEEIQRAAISIRKIDDVLTQLDLTDSQKEDIFFMRETLTSYYSKHMSEKDCGMVKQGMKEMQKYSIPENQA